MKKIYLTLFLAFALLSGQAKIYTIINFSHAGGLDLKACIDSANTNPGKDTINFNLSSILPITFESMAAIRDSLFIDGLSQPGSTPTSLKVTWEMDEVLHIQSDNCSISGIRFVKGSVGSNPNSLIFFADTINQISNFTLSNTFFQNFPLAISISMSTASPHTMSNFYFYSNYFYSSSGSPIKAINITQNTSNVLTNFSFEENTFQSNEVELHFEPQVIPNSFTFLDNDFDLTFKIFGDVKGLECRNNSFDKQVSFLSGNISDVVIADNHFYPEGMDFQCSGERISISGNSFGYGSIDFLLSGNLKSVSIHGNTFGDSDGIEFNFSTNTGNTIYCSGVTISENTFDLSVPQNDVNYVFFNLENSISKCVIDSINILKNNMTNGAISFLCNGFGFYDSISTVVIDSNIITGNNNLVMGIRVENLYNTQVENVTISNNVINEFINGIWIRSMGTFTGWSFMQNINIAGNEIVECNNGIYVNNHSLFHAENTLSDVTILNNHLHNNYNDGINLVVESHGLSSVNTTQNLEIINNDIHDNSAYGIHFLDIRTDSIDIDPIYDHITYSQNKIYNNGLLGIYNEYDGDATAPHGPIPYPVPHIMNVDISSLVLTGEIQGDTLTDYRIEVFGNTDCDPSGYGEGEFYLGDLICSTNISGFGVFQFNIPNNNYSRFSSTATSLITGNTSVFSNCGDSATAVGEISSNKYFVYPNPVNNYCFISNLQKKPKSIFLYSMLGTKTDLMGLFDDGKIFLEKFTPGVYQLVVDGLSTRLVINR